MTNSLCQFMKKFRSGFRCPMGSETMIWINSGVLKLCIVELCIKDCGPVRIKWNMYNTYIVAAYWMLKESKLLLSRSFMDVALIPHCQWGLGKGEVISYIASLSHCIALCRCSIKDLWPSEIHHLIAVTVTPSYRSHRNGWMIHIRLGFLQITFTFWATKRQNRSKWSHVHFL